MRGQVLPALKPSSGEDDDVKTSTYLAASFGVFFVCWIVIAFVLQHRAAQASPPHLTKHTGGQSPPP